jgi:hypothetical protein
MDTYRIGAAAKAAGDQVHCGLVGSALFLDLVAPPLNYQRESTVFCRV